MTPPPLPIHKSQNQMIRKRPSEAISLTNSSSIPVQADSSRVIKKRQTNAIDHVLTSTIGPSSISVQSYDEDEDDEECIILQPQHDRLPSPYERPHCPIPGQIRHNYNHPTSASSSSYVITPRRPSNASTLNNSISSYLTLPNNHDTLMHVAQH